MNNSTTTVHGVLPIDKPLGPTSHDIVQHIRKLSGTKKVGHTGTLDPQASGILLVTIGSATRLSQYTSSLQKTYRAQITLGATSSTDDAEGTLTHIEVASPPTIQEIAHAATSFVGALQQIPPWYAAVKVKGRKLYEYAREKGDITHIQRPVKSIHIYRLDIVSYAYPHLEIEVQCSAGTYIRALARDIGQALRTGAYLSSLRRIKIGPWNIDQAINPNTITPASLLTNIHAPITLVSHLPQIIVTTANVAKLKQGRAVVLKKNLPTNQPIAILDTAGILIGIGRYNPVTDLLNPQRLLSS